MKWRTYRNIIAVFIVKLSLKTQQMCFNMVFLFQGSCVLKVGTQKCGNFLYFSIWWKSLAKKFVLCLHGFIENSWDSLSFWNLQAICEIWEIRWDCYFWNFRCFSRVLAFFREILKVLWTLGCWFWNFAVMLFVIIN